MSVDLDNSSTVSGEASVSSTGNQQNPLPKSAAEQKRNLPGMPDPDSELPDSEVIALSPETLLATNRFICEICNKGFQREQNLQLHLRGHNLPWKLRQKSSKKVKRKVYVCPETSCVHHDPSRALGDLTGIKKHFSRKHGEKKWKCDKPQHTTNLSIIANISSSSSSVTKATATQPLSSSSPSPNSSGYENQKRRDWNTFGQYLRNLRPPVSLSRCSGAHVLEFLRYLDQFGKTKVHTTVCHFYGHPNPPAPCPCPLRQAWGSLDALIGRLRVAFEENGGKPETNPFGARAVRLYLREVRDTQSKARGVSYEKKKRKRPVPQLSASSSSAVASHQQFQMLPESPETPREILQEARGYAYKKGDEVILAKNIVRDVCLSLSSETNTKQRGTRLSLQSILSLLNRSHPSAPQIVGLWGMAGIGKTTITNDFLRTQAERYDVCYFLPDCHLMCQTKGLSCLRDEFFSKVFGEEKGFIDACDTKLSFTRDRFLGKKVLIVLDGVSSARDAEFLVGGFGWFSGGHTIILTSRNRQVLVQCNAKDIYEIEKLSKPESLHLFGTVATKENWKGKMSLTSELVNYASGNPLAVRVLGLSIQKQSIEDQKQQLRRLRQHPPIEFQNAFRISFSERDDDEKSIFLDLACFFRGENKDHVVTILDGCGFSTDLGIYGLIDESLISLVDNKIEMPNIFQDAGRFVVCQEHEESGKRSRLWDSSDIVSVLTHNTGTEAIEGIFLDASSLTFDLSSTAFQRMYRLRLLKIHCPTSVNHCKVCLPEGLHSLPDELRLLHWERYPLGSLPRNFNPKNLVELNMTYSNLTEVWKGTKNLEKLKRIVLSHSQQLTKFPRLSKARNLEHIDLEGCTSLVKVNSSILHHHKLTFLSLKNCSHLRVMPTTVHLKSLEVLNLSGCSELENLQDFSSNLKELYLAGTAIREMPLSIGDLTSLVTLDLENCESLQNLPPGISNLKAMMTLKLSGCSNLKSLPVLDALFPQDSQRPNTRNITMEESVSISLHSAVQVSRLDGSETLLNLDNLLLRSDNHGSCFSREAVEEFLPAFDCLSNNGIPQESWTWVTAIPFPSSILHSLASRLYALVSLFLCNAYLVDIPEDISLLTSVMRLDLGGNSFSQIPNSIKEFRKLHSLRLRHCKNLKSLPELPRSLVVLNANGCVSLKSFPSSFEQFPRHYTFSNCFNLSPKVVRKYIGKALDSVEGMAKGILQASQELEHINAPAFSICIPASAGHQSSVNLQAGSSVRIQLASGILKTLSGFVLSVVVEFWDSYSNTAGFGIKCICRKSKLDLSPRLERIFHFWAPKEPTTVRRDHMFVFGSVKMHNAEAVNHDFLSDSVTFEFHPVNSENQLLGESCTVKRCGVYLITDATCNTAPSAKRPSSSMDPGKLSSKEHVEPPYKRCRLKGVIEIVILSLRKRKRETSVPTVKSFSKVKSLCRSYVRTGNCAVGPSCSFDHPTWVLKHKTESSIPSESPRMDMLGLSSFGKPSDKRVETSTKQTNRLSVSESRQATSGKDTVDKEQEEG